MGGVADLALVPDSKQGSDAGLVPVVRTPQCVRTAEWQREWQSRCTVARCREHASTSLASVVRIDTWLEDWCLDWACNVSCVLWCTVICVSGARAHVTQVVRLINRVKIVSGGCVVVTVTCPLVHFFPCSFATMGHGVFARFWACVRRPLGFPRALCTCCWF